MSKMLALAALVALTGAACDAGHKTTTTTTTRTTTDIDTGKVKSLHRGEMAAIKSYDDVIGKTNEASWKSTLDRIRGEHATAVTLLRDRVAALGATPDDTPGAWGGFAEAWASMGATISDAGGRDALKSGEKHGIDDYEAALKNDKVDADTKALISDKLLPQTRQHVADLDALKKRRSDVATLEKQHERSPPASLDVTCAHPPCGCTETAMVRDGKAYCSEDCARAARSSDPRCPCEHGECTAGSSKSAGSSPQKGRS